MNVGLLIGAIFVAAAVVFAGSLRRWQVVAAAVVVAAGSLAWARLLSLLSVSDAAGATTAQGVAVFCGVSLGILAIAFAAIPAGAEVEVAP